MTDFDREKWITVEYYRSLSGHVSDGLRYFNQMISWGNNLVLANVLAIGVTMLLSKNFVPYNILTVFGLFMLTLLHYLVLRSARGYANLIRFTSIQKEVTKWVLEGAKAEKFGTVNEHIQTYHVGWVSPLNRGTILSKVWLSSGFIFHAFVVSAMLIFCLKQIPWDLACKSFFVVFFAANMILFIFYFARCRYFKNCLPYPNLDDQA